MATTSPSVQDALTHDDLALPLLPGRKLTFEEFLEWCRGHEHARVEWVDGGVVGMSPVSFDHSNLGLFLGTILRMFVEHHDLGSVLGPEYLCRFQAKRRKVARQPDLIFLAVDRSNLIRSTFLDGVPDLIVEIVSPDSVERDYREKHRDYESGGVREYWVVDPLTKRVEVWSRNAETGKFEAVVEADGQFTSTVLPGFFLRQDWLWREPLPKLSTVLQTLGV